MVPCTEILIFLLEIVMSQNISTVNPSQMEEKIFRSWVSLFLGICSHFSAFLRYKYICVTSHAYFQFLVVYKK